MTTLVTGGTGFVGSAVVRALLDHGHNVRVLVRRQSDRSNLEKLPVEIVEGDLCHPPSLEEAVRGCASVFHVAADYRLWVRNAEEMYKTNVDGTEALLGFAVNAGVERFIHTSSVATLGVDPLKRPADEETPVAFTDMVGHYHRSKFLAEQAAKRYIARGAPIIIVHPSMPLGPRDLKPTPTGRTVVAAAAGRIPAYVDTGINVVHVDDVAEGHVLALERGRIGANYILGGEDMTLRKFLCLIAQFCGRRQHLFRLPHLAAVPVAYVSEAWAFLSGGVPLATRDEIKMSRKYMYFSSARARRELGYHARPANDAIRDAVAWFARHGTVHLGASIVAQEATSA